MSDILARRKAGFVLWRPAAVLPPPKVRVVRLIPGSPPQASLVFEAPLQRAPGFDDLWELPLSQTTLLEQDVLHYWFVITKDDGTEVEVSDPFAHVVDYRLDGDYPAAVIKVQAGQLVDCDPDGNVGVPALGSAVASHATNTQLVIYEIPSSWTRGATESGTERDVGTFRDVLALLEADEPGANFRGMPEVASRAHLLELGVNAVELLPPADSPFNREWGYGTGHYLAADWDLGFPVGFAAPTAEQDLRKLVARMHDLGIRFFADVVMAFGYTSYRELNFDEFYIVVERETDSADSYQSSRQGELRDGFGGSLWRYQREVESYDPVSGTKRRLVPARAFLLTSVLRWLRELGVDGLRLDSVNNIGNWDFVGEFTRLARAEYHRLFPGVPDLDARFLSIGEELSVPKALVHQGRLDCLWNEAFKRRVRGVLLGRGADGESFEQTLRKMVDCREDGFTDGSQVVNYLTSHDVEGFENERLFLFLQNSGVGLKLERFKLAFSCLFLSVGIPMILAGEEFADQHDRPLSHPDKQQDPLNFSRLADPWRKELFDYVARLVRFRKTAPALAVNDTRFIHMDFTGGRRIASWVRGTEGQDPVVTVANFSGVTPAGDEYRIPNWPATPPGRRWREVTQARDVPAEWVGREPLFPWEAKVYTLAS